jgi:hypothetical protein
MTMQSMNTSAARNTFKAAMKPDTVKAPAHSTAITADKHQSAPVKPGSTVKGFSGSGLKPAKV